MVGKSYLLFYYRRLESIEQPKRVNDIALDQDGHYDSGGRPESRTDGHLPEPRLEREAGLTAKAALALPDHLVHRENCGVVPRYAAYVLVQVLTESRRVGEMCRLLKLRLFMLSCKMYSLVE